MSALDRLEGRIRLMVGRAIVRLVDDAKQAQELQLDLLSDETQDAAERFQNYGLTAHPHPEAEALVVFAGGLRSHPIVIAVEDRRYRLKDLEQGEVALFDDLGNVVKLGRDAIVVTAVGDLTATVAGKASIDIEGDATVHATSVTVTADGGATINADTTINGDVRVNGKIDASGDVTGQGTSLHTHTHGGVSTGSGQTGNPV